MALRERVEEREADRAVLDALRGRRGVATRGDLILDTALPESTVVAALERLLDRYDSAMRREGDALVYRFAPGFRRRPERRPALRALLASAWRVGRSTARGARTAFRIVLAVQLVTYAAIVLLPVSLVVGVVAGVALLIVGALSDSGVAELLLEPWALAIALALCVSVGFAWAVKKKLSLLLGLLGVRAVDAKAGKTDALVARVDAFALGPPGTRPRGERLDRTWRIAQADEARVLARVRAAGGVLRSGDLVSWLGMGLDEADRQATRLAVEYGGEPSMPPEVPVLEFRFPALVATAGGPSRVSAEEATSVERQDPLSPFTGNRRRVDAGIAGFAAVNLGAGLGAVAILGPWATGAWPARVGWLVAWPAIVCSTLLFGLALVRLPTWLVGRARAAIRRTRSRIVRAIATEARLRPGRGVDLAAVELRMPQDEGLPRLSPGQLRAIALELAGEHDVDDVEAPTKTLWRFRRLEHELRR